MTRRRASASRRSPRLVEPETSEKMIVTSFRVSAMTRVYDSLLGSSLSRRPGRQDDRSSSPPPSSRSAAGLNYWPRCARGRRRRRRAGATAGLVPPTSQRGTRRLDPRHPPLPPQRWGSCRRVAPGVGRTRRTLRPAAPLRPSPRRRVRSDQEREVLKSSKPRHSKGQEAARESSGYGRLP